MATDLRVLSREAFEAQQTGGVEAMLKYIHPDFEMETPREIAAEPQVYRGHDGIRRWWESFYEVMDEVSVVPVDVEPLGPDRALVHFQLRARGSSSGIEVNQEARAIATVRDDLILRLDFILPGQEPG